MDKLIHVKLDGTPEEEKASIEKFLAECQAEGLEYLIDEDDTKKE